ncbi:FtsX-like permease family protein [Mucilaginibacter corticis]|uniref:FtsX-like permease family protein n=1 Tax=Mucilaginibacter corticis TaxID=2597670 RepID=A0A556MSW2_9SPHI|nr:ABC transporter permease [Mucilaginibacter corticis]TSJ43040.1 FtsX-like permease family protein [Mucilaginibacter corticis]
MLKNYIKIAWRNIINKKLYSAINIIGLTVGLAVGLLILLWVQDETSYDKFNTKIDRIYKVNASIGAGASKQVWGGVQPPVAFYALKEVPNIESAVRIIDVWKYSKFTYQNKTIRVNTPMKFVDNSFFTMFDYQLLKGDAKKPFPNDQSVILSESEARKYFGDTDPIGKVLTANNKDLYTVSGVIEDMRANSSIQAGMLFSMKAKAKEYDGKGMWKAMDEDWGNYYTQTYLLIKPNASTTSIADKLTRIHMKLQQGIKPTDGVYQLQSLADVHLYNPDGTSSGAQIVKIFTIVAILILLIACINYVNLSTARSVLRSKEVSVRKIIGAERKHLFFQFVFETVLCFLIALALSFALIYAIMPVYNRIAGKEMQFNLFSAGVWKVIGTTIVATLAASSIYPAVLLSSFQPIDALRSRSTAVGSGAFRKVLVVCQFAFSIGLIIGTLVINRQLNFIQTTQVGFDRDHVFSVNMGDNMFPHQEAVKAELLRHQEISGVAVGDNIVSGGSSTGDTDWDGKPTDASMIIHPFFIDKNFINVFKVQFVAGGNFTGEKADSAHFILNETAVRQAGIKNPIGKRFKLWQTDGTIIGVVKDFHFASLKQAIEPAIFTYTAKSGQLFVRTTGKDAAVAIKLVQGYHEQYNHGDPPFEYKFLDEDFNNIYKTEQSTSALFNIFAGIAIFISCLGLFGLATYTAQVKVKEIGIRKVLGASVVSITTMLSKDFLLLVIISLVIAGPIAWYAMNTWLQDYAYRVSLSWTIIPFAGISALLIALATISFQAVKAALTNPVKSLRSE